MRILNTLQQTNNDLDDISLEFPGQDAWTNSFTIVNQHNTNAPRLSNLSIQSSEFPCQTHIAANITSQRRGRWMDLLVRPRYRLHHGASRTHPQGHSYSRISYQHINIIIRPARQRCSRVTILSIDTFLGVSMPATHRGEYNLSEEKTMVGRTCGTTTQPKLRCFED